MGEAREDFDFLIIGSGGAALSAALAAHEAGLRTLVVEKGDKVGGTTALSGGALWIPNNPVMLRAGATDSEADAKAYIDGCAGAPTRGSTPERRRRFIEEGPKMVTFLESIGMKFTYADGWACYHHLEQPGGHARGRSIQGAIFDLNDLGAWKDRILQRPVQLPPVLTHEAYKVVPGPVNWTVRLLMLRVGLRMIRNRMGARLNGMGLALMGRMLKLVVDRNISVWTNAVTRRLVVEGGRVVGAEIEHDGRVRTVRAPRGVLLAAGGFSRNAAMREKYLPKPTKAGWFHGSQTDTGEIIEMAQGLGAALDLMDHAVWIPSSELPNGMALMHTGDMTRPHCILVDPAGRRYLNESSSYVTAGQRMFKRHAESGDHPGWYIFDGQFRYRWGGLPVASAPIEDWVKSGYMIRAGSLDELASRCGINRDGLLETVRRFNEFARKGVDEDQQRGHNAHNRFSGDPSVGPNPNLGSIEKAPFYAVKAIPGDVGTAGGLVTDDEARVLREDGSVIEGLYAAGNTAATPMGRSYPGAGASIGPAFVFGYVAARHAARHAQA